MVKYRRCYISGGTYFFTVNLDDRKLDWLTKYIAQLKDAMRRVNEIHPFKTHAFVVLPDHLHVIWQLPDGDVNYSLRWRCIKTQFAKNLNGVGVSIVKNFRQENFLWQKRFWEHTIKDETDFERHVNYIHYNPVKHGYVKRVADWPYSLFIVM